MSHKIDIEDHHYKMLTYEMETMKLTSRAAVVRKILMNYFAKYRNNEQIKFDYEKHNLVYCGEYEEKYG